MQEGLYQLLKSIFDCIYSQDLRYDQTMDQISIKKKKTRGHLYLKLELIFVMNSRN